MYVLVLNDNIFQFNDVKDIKEFLSTLFNYANNRRFLYFTIGNSLIDILVRHKKGESSYDQIVVPARASFKYLCEEYGEVYDPDKKLLTVQKEV